ncbi:epoxyqueuosine reductase QueG [Dysgonomonas alginatilytica]|uniref:Epoxyqueuosine reductase QueG n=1 Tax=Dysgonomonas alginatilytica TaxID=1605892 RepID=A0A2V3PKN5_9BACT|nr:epoxyqueuosine reductase [Dysgonomonas alginatilytica]PXV58941.1 epoxyqueuosine reductase QueG [Dysgonomonas alginatilytica]
MDKKTVKELAKSLGADLVGVAATDRFVDSPAGHSPVDKFPVCKSVIVLGCTFPQETLKLDTVSYTTVRNRMVEKLDSLAEQLATELKKRKIRTKAIKSASGRFVDGGFYGTISLKHAGELAGLGIIGRNYLLCNEKYGNLLWLGAVLTDLELESDSLLNYNFCGNCSLCIDTCPSSAIDGKGNIDQNACRRTCYIVTKGVLDLKCWRCREVCPHKFGFKQ